MHFLVRIVGKTLVDTMLLFSEHQLDYYVIYKYLYFHIYFVSFFIIFISRLEYGSVEPTALSAKFTRRGPDQRIQSTAGVLGGRIDADKARLPPIQSLQREKQRTKNTGRKT